VSIPRMLSISRSIEANSSSTVVPEASGVLPSGVSVPVGTEVADTTKAVGDESGTTSLEHATSNNIPIVTKTGSRKRAILITRQEGIG